MLRLWFSNFLHVGTLWRALQEHQGLGSTPRDSDIISLCQVGRFKNSTHGSSIQWCFETIFTSSVVSNLLNLKEFLELGGKVRTRGYWPALTNGNIMWAANMRYVCKLQFSSHHTQGSKRTQWSLMFVFIMLYFFFFFFLVPDATLYSNKIF